MSNLVDSIIAYESGEMTAEEMVYFFAELVKTGQAWTLQGHYGRTAHRLIEMGIIIENGDIDEMTAIENGINL
jgi:hypothetical protein